MVRHERFVQLEAPSEEDVAGIAVQVATRVVRMLRRRGKVEDDEVAWVEDDGSVLLPCMAASVQRVGALGEGEGRALRRPGRRRDSEVVRVERRRCADVDGFSLHADVCVPPRDRAQLERLCRYLARPAIAAERLELLSERYNFKRTWRDGPVAFEFDPIDLVGKLAALVPRPRSNLVRYHGCLAPHASLRAYVVRDGRGPPPSKAEVTAMAAARTAWRVGSCAAQSCAPPRERGLQWADLMQLCTCGQRGVEESVMVASASNDGAIPKVLASIERWKHSLLDLGKRNRALNFKPSPVSTIVVVDEQPPEVFARLRVEGESMGFLPTKAEADVTRLSEEGDQAESQRLLEELADTADFAPYDRTALASRHTDEWLQTRLSTDKLARALRRIDDVARGSLEEQGVNTLFLALGMLHYKESDISDQVFAAPLVLLPVRLSRAANNGGFEIFAAEDDVVVNLSLREYLRRQWKLDLPTFTEVEGEAPDLQAFFIQVAERIRNRVGWRLTNEIVLSLFSFEKLVMYHELNENAAAIAGHPLVQQLVTRQGQAGGGVFGLPVDVQTASLDDEIPPERSGHLVPADGSQLRALLAVAKGHNMVIEGPPGTGKSQTITNLIAQTLNAGKSVLFVAEKQAALDVVHARLVASGLGEFCLVLHSPDVSRREVFERMKTALDASTESSPPSLPAAKRLPTLRATLTSYTAALHTKRPPLDVSVFDAYGHLAKVADAPLVPWNGTAAGVTADQLADGLRALTDLARASADVGEPTQHPWRDVGRVSFPDVVMQDVLRVVDELDQSLARFEHFAAQAAGSLGVPFAESFAFLPYLQAVADVLRRSPGAPIEVLHDATWARPPAAVADLLAQLRDVQDLRATCLQRFVPQALQIDHAADIAYVRSKGAVSKALAFLDGRYKEIRRRWESLGNPGYEASPDEQADHLALIGRLQQLHAALAQREWEGRSLFGWWWRGAESSQAELSAYVQWVVEFRALAGSGHLGQLAFEVASRGGADVSAIAELVYSSTAATQSASRLISALQWPATYFDNLPVAAIRKRIAELVAHPDRAPGWASFESSRRVASASTAGWIAELGDSGRLGFAALPAAFLRSFWSQWLMHVVDADPMLAGFQGLAHEQRVEEFRDLDRGVQVENRDRLVAQLRRRLQIRLGELPAEMAVLLPEVRKQGRHKPLRKTLLAAGAAARAIHPCWLMSPLAVSQFTQPGGATFDLVVFDEASQMRPEDAVSAISRGQQLVVVGDPKQLPPSDFFSAHLGAPVTEADEDDDHPDAPSILEVVAGSGLPTTRLKWHYRSAHESLIAFSNEMFYDAELRTFPSVETGRMTAGLRFEYVEGGVYEGNGRNRAEAERVVEAILGFAREQQRKPAKERLSLGVGTFNLRQRPEIDDLLYERRKTEPTLAEFFDRDREDPFFIKNLESIQGDERDVIFLSITYGRAADGSFRNTFGPLNKEGGWKRLNVITTRARKVMRVFSSIRGSDIQADRSKIGPLLKAFLEYAETGRMQGATADRRLAAESPFEREVGDELERRGHKVEAQVGECGYRIDLAISDPDDPGRYLLGIECDGVAYHASETARDRDRLREDVLRGRGWEIARVWSTDWFKARAGQITRLEQAIHAAREKRRARLLEAADAPEASSPEPAPPVATPVAAPRATQPPPRGAPKERSASSEPPRSRVPLVVYEIATPAVEVGGGLLEAAIQRVVAAAVAVAQVESPIHEDELASRLANAWGHQRAGARIRDHVVAALRAAEQSGVLERRGQFLWVPGRACVARFRGDAGPSEPGRIAPEEYIAAIRHVLAGGPLLRERLVVEVRGALGFARTGKHLEAHIGEGIERLRASAEVVEMTSGLQIAPRPARRTDEVPMMTDVPSA